jgi:putative transposase
LHPEPWTVEVEHEYHERFSCQTEKWLDEGHGSCVLRHSKCREIVTGALMHFEGKRCHQISWVVMPNHVHPLFVLRGGEELAALLHSWNGFSGQEINVLLGRRGTFWQKDYFDRLLRDGQHLDNCIRYIRRNPAKATLREGEFTLFESDFAKSVM